MHVEWPVEAELDADLLDRLLGGGGPGEIGRGIAGQRPRQQEGDDHHADQARHRDQHALDDHHQHGSICPNHVVVPVQAGTHIPEPVVMGPRFRGDDSDPN